MLQGEIFQEKQQVQLQLGFKGGIRTARRPPELIEAETRQRERLELPGPESLLFLALAAKSAGVTKEEFARDLGISVRVDD